ncbi:MAG: hypothetical protein JWQ98_557 [Chlorobi bacterium]|nr:hypothetical protein [Chlorobiota bacterium]
MWGDLRATTQNSGFVRFIPTHVGRSGRILSGRWNGSVHPHACGEILPIRKWNCSFSGSSPRMWGDPCRRCQGRHQLRFIPTHVGRSQCRGEISRLAPVHPHACGEIGVDISQMEYRSGSSPRMWGDPVFADIGGELIRFIPTHVGRSTPSRMTVIELAVHPHACGEIVLADYPAAAKGGSSPRMWGDRGNRGRPAWRHRFIPTHVGRSLAAIIQCRNHSVHPHACGEIASLPHTIHRSIGSSPRMWGDHRLLAFIATTARFIPTHVGRSTRSSVPGHRPSVHPHACGEISASRRTAT